VRGEVVFDCEAVIESKLVTQLEFAPELRVTLSGRHARLVPDMREMSYLHWMRTSPKHKTRILNAALVGCSERGWVMQMLSGYRGERLFT
jgi:hypothetical protein